jgi:hypothetical protein
MDGEISAVPSRLTLHPSFVRQNRRYTLAPKPVAVTGKPKLMKSQSLARGVHLGAPSRILVLIPES